MALRKMISVAAIAEAYGLPESRVILKLKYGGIHVTLPSSSVHPEDVRRIFGANAAIKSANANTPRRRASAVKEDRPPISWIATRYNIVPEDVVRILHDAKKGYPTDVTEIPIATVHEVFGTDPDNPLILHSRFLAPGTCPGCGRTAVVSGQVLCDECARRLALPPSMTGGASRSRNPSAALVNRWVGTCWNCAPPLRYSLLLQISADRPDIWCRVCTTSVVMERMKVEYSASHLCDPRCRWAYGEQCKCSCGGVNHRAGFSLN